MSEEKLPMSSEERVSRLLGEIEKKGIKQISQSEDLDATDRALLELMASFESLFPEAQEAAVLLKERRLADRTTEFQKYKIEGLAP